jgi:hypothetical protein
MRRMEITCDNEYKVRFHLSRVQYLQNGVTLISFNRLTGKKHPWFLPLV